MHVYYIMIKSSQKFWVVYVRYRFIPEQCVRSVTFYSNILDHTFAVHFMHMNNPQIQG